MGKISNFIKNNYILIFPPIFTLNIYPNYTLPNLKWRTFGATTLCCLYWIRCCLVACCFKHEPANREILTYPMLYSHNCSYSISYSIYNVGTPRFALRVKAHITSTMTQLSTKLDTLHCMSELNSSGAFHRPGRKLMVKGWRHMAELTPTLILYT